VLAQATFPVTIDPLLSVFPVSTQTTNEHTPDIAFDAGSNRYFVVWEYDYSAGDHDIYAEILDVNGVPVPNGFTLIDTTTQYWTRPRVATTAGYMLTVATRGLQLARQVWARNAYAGQAGVLGAQFAVSTLPFPIESFNADVADQLAHRRALWLVAYECSLGTPTTTSSGR